MGKAVTKVNKSEMAEFDPSMFEADAGTGINDMSQEDLALPFLKSYLVWIHYLMNLRKPNAVIYITLCLVRFIKVRRVSV